ncbi:unnamed protein product [Ostreobium quekettii]|uniref:Actin-related protein 2/3 complex subunit 4 n=1 Tax=Ostreobium quekettii TaxID=121088 RepID=A0A8S1J6I1_9CHLO|nr:unnamed protein product [Ostreobium quekettii]|eukprot:evm.model.scf_724.5 EVM.evm.TU.scf_724.5   scf_724:41783-43833(+)
MALSHRQYIDALREALGPALCVRGFPCQDVERHNKPEVEYQSSGELLLEPVTVARSDGARVLIEGAINSVRVSVKIKQSDALEQILVRMYMRFLMQRAESFEILRRVPVEDYDISFLITDAHCLRMSRRGLQEFICGLVADMDAEISRLKLAVNTRGRAVASEFLRSMTA